MNRNKRKTDRIEPVKKLLTFLFKDEPDLLPWFWQWLAYPIQNPGGKNLTAVLLYSIFQGIGKSFVGYIMKGIYGDNFVVVDSEAMKGNFNGWVVNKQFILGEEITGNNSRAQADRLKNMITREQIHVNEKYQPEYDIEDCSNILLTSNHVDAVFLEDSDRRFVVIETKGPPMPQSDYDEVDRWRKNDGASYLFHHLLHNVDLSDYNPKAHAPMSAAKRRMIDISKSDLDLAVIQIRDNPDDILRGRNIINECPLLTTTQLQSFINSYTDGNSTLIAVSKALRRGGFRQEKINVVDGCQRVWAVRDTQKLGRMDASEWVAIYNEFHPQQKF